MHKPKIKEIKSAKKMKEIMADYFYDLDKASKSKKEKVAWCTSIGPAELLRSFGFKVHFPENHGAILGVTRTANDYIPIANAIGYSPDICSYLTSDIGAYIKKETPLYRIYKIKSLPKPDVLVYNTNQCRDVQEWFYWYSRELNVPMIGVNSPKAMGKMNDIYIKDVEAQLKNMTELLEKISDRKFDKNELKKCLKFSQDATLLWKDVLNTAKNIPSPLTFFDGCIHMGPIVVLRGEKIAVDYYKMLREEMEERIKNNVSAVDNEKFRLYWEGMPIWGKLSALAKQFIKLKTCIVASTYCNSWIFESFNPSKPFYSMAKAYTEIFIVRSEEFKEEYIKRLVKEFSIDGVIFHDSKTCPSNSNARYGMPQRLQNYGIPTLIINGDLNDLRCYSEEQARTNIEAFIEELEEK